MDVKRQSGKISQFFLMMIGAAFVFAIASTVMAAGADQMTGGKTSAAAAVSGNELVSIAPSINIDDKLRSDLEKKLAAINAKYDVHLGVVFMESLPGGKSAEQVAKSIAEGGSGYEQIFPLRIYSFSLFFVPLHNILTFVSYLLHLIISESLL